jgi:hypothetical protein
VNKDIQKQWTDRLRSGDLVQGKGALHQGDGSLCCLGVLCEVAYEAGAVTRSQFTNAGQFHYGKYEEASVLPPEVIAWAGFPEGSYEQLRNPSVTEVEGTEQSLAELNDELEWNFEQIADVIDQAVKEGKL